MLQVLSSVVAALTPRQKRVILMSFDCGLVPVSLYLAFALRFGTGMPLDQAGLSWALFLLLVLAAPFVITALRLPWIKLGALDLAGLGRIAVVAGILGGGAVVLSYVLMLGAPRSVPIIFASTFFWLAVLGRGLAVILLRRLLGRSRNRVPVAIYGAGAAGIQLASALRQSYEMLPVVFLDDNPALHGSLISGLRVDPASQLHRLVAKRRIKRVLVAMPSLHKTQVDVVLSRLEKLSCDVHVLPSYENLISGKDNISHLKPLSPDALLGRDKVNLDTPEIAKAYAGRVVMVTGAGGSIGSELCRQLLECRAARIVLFEQNEFGLYEINRELKKQAEAAGIPVVAKLGSVTNSARVEAVMQGEGVDIVLHAAAYKHVPLVEENELEGARNNVLGTQIVAETANRLRVERFILISTDKAVRPTSIMGATKRMAELVIQDLQTRSTKTTFAMVRFGNVLGSSGSVLPLFQQQIAAGGPVTVTHPDVTRFFMTISEASRLVLLAGAYAKDGNVFVLDMGQPIKIMDLAHRMIELSGSFVRKTATGDGTAIDLIGLRPGEKLYEELLIDQDSLIATPHDKILRAHEVKLSQIEVAGMLKDIATSLTQGNPDRLRGVVQKYIQGYHKQKDVGTIR